MNKKEFTYYLKNPNEITAPILGQMMLYDDTRARETQSYSLEAEFLYKAMSSISNSDDWIEYRNYLGMINNLRYNFAEAKYYEQMARCQIAKISSMYSRALISALHYIRTGQILEENKEYKTFVSKENYSKAIIEMYLSDLRNSLQRLLAFNKLIEIVSLKTKTPTVKNFLIDISEIEAELESLTESSHKIEEIKKEFPEENEIFLKELPLLNLKISYYQPAKNSVKIVNESILERGAFLRNFERVNNQFIRDLIKGDKA